MLNETFLSTYIFKTKIMYHLFKISAVDNDFGPDGDLEIEIQSVSNNGDGKFKIQQISSEKKAFIICIGKLSRNLTYVIMIRASDQAIHVFRRR